MSEYRDGVSGRGNNKTDSTDDELLVFSKHVLALKIQDERTCCFSTLARASKRNVTPLDLTIASCEIRIAFGIPESCLPH